jgi:putative Holliday junction resolvase|tara:strand:- start:18662 stop:19075 length:414 start_codon:yes stop_codon:yes gene_type:complete
MPMALGFDYGLTRIGVATGQTVTQTASPLTTLRAKDGIPDWQELECLLKEWTPDVIVVGLPLHQDNTLSEIATRAQKFGNRIHGRYGLSVEYVNEYNTTQEARYLLKYRGKSSEQDGVLDTTAACLILERWLGEHYG